MSREAKFQEFWNDFFNVASPQQLVQWAGTQSPAGLSDTDQVFLAYHLRGELTLEQAQDHDYSAMHEGVRRVEYWTGRLEDGLSHEDLLWQMIEEAYAARANVSENMGMNQDEDIRKQQIEIAEQLVSAAQYQSDNNIQSSEDLYTLVQSLADQYDTAHSKTRLTTDSDTLTGSLSNNYFDASLATEGGLAANTLNSGDSINGIAGDNTLFAQVMPETDVGAITGTGDGRPIHPSTQNVQTLKFEAQDGGQRDQGVTINASDLLDVEHIGSYDSNASLVIQDLNTRDSDDGSKRYTDEITFRMDHTSNQNTAGGASDLKAYFDENYLIERVEGDLTEIYFEMMNTNAHRAGHDPLVSVFVRRMEFDVNDVTVSVHEFLDGEVYESTGENITTYRELVDALYTEDADGTPQGALPDALGAAGLERDAAIARIGDEFSFFDGDTGETVVGDHQIVIEATPGNTVSHLNAELEVAQTQTRAEVNGERIDNWSRHERVDFDEEPGDQELKTTVELHKVGRGSDGGNVLIGGKSQSATSQGIPVFDVEVLGGDDKPSNIGWLGTTNSDLETVNIRSVDYDNRVDEDGETTWADLTIRDGFSPDVVDDDGNPVVDDDGNPVVAPQDSLERVDAREFEGNLTLGRNLTTEPATITDNTDITRNVQNLHNLYGNGASSTELFGTIDQDGSYTYRNSTDDLEVDLSNEGNIDFSLDTGGGDDVIKVNLLDGESVNALGTNFEIASSSGDNYVNVRMTDGVSQATMAELENLSIETGTGDDTVIVNGRGTFDIDTGGGDDLVIIQSADRGDLGRNYSDRYEVEGFDAENGNGSLGEWTIGQTTGAQDWGTSGQWTADASARVLYNAKLTLTFAGIEETVEIDTDDQFIATQVDINNAIKDAIDDNHELSQLLNYSDAEGNQALTIESLVGGENNLAIAIYQPQLVADADNLSEDLNEGRDVLIGGGDVSALRQGLIETGFRDSDSDHLEDADAIAARTNHNDFYGAVDGDGVGDGGLRSTIQYSHDNPDTGDNGYGDGNDIFGQNDYFDLSGGTSRTSRDDVTGISEAVINAGGGQNVVVMHSNPLSSNTLVIDDSMGANDKVTVVNWHTESPESVDNVNQMGQHALDFSHFLTDEHDPSSDDNRDSADLVDPVTNVVNNNAEAFSDQSVDVTNSANARANTVNVIRFDGDEDDTFEDLDGSTLVRALNDADDDGDSNYGNLTGGLLTPDLDNVNPVDNTLNHIIMVESDRNEGEYKLFHVTSTWDVDNNETTNLSENGNDQFDTNVQELGTLDFGAAINVKLAGSELHKNYLTAVRDAVDQAVAAGNDVRAVKEVVYQNSRGEDQTVVNPGYGAEIEGFMVEALDVPGYVQLDEGADDVTVPIEGTVRNTGDEDTQDIKLTVGDKETIWEDEKIPAGDSFQIPDGTTFDLGEGTHEVTLSTDDDSRTKFVEVGEDDVQIDPDRHVYDVEDGDDLDADEIAADNNMDAVSFAFPEPALPGDSVFIENFNEGDQLDFGALGLEEFSEENFDFTTRSEATNTVRVRVGEDVDNFDEPSWFANLVGVDQDVFDQFQDFQDDEIGVDQLIEQVGVALDTEDWLAV
ncbi:hypothetical protein CKO15_07185 [Halorhodospira abdelmalekii]|uniref:hypothetical protein n=1 Tax=Halorhodospira abdelmalekii TaxID=421629 RepID=UPI00190876F0|nr:hypothetical protein [Halorhodospira abdelmalekii]MBK1735071.1 hypothetical protein [Halorhodospira abdelmalekii]